MKLLKFLFVLALISCGCSKVTNQSADKTASQKEVYSIAISEYPSWSTFAVAAKQGLINPNEGGEPGSLEKKWNVDIVLQIRDYDACLAMYGSGATDAVCITNIDVLNLALDRPTTAIFPTSTSAGADKVIGLNYDGKPNDPKKIQAYLIGKKVYGLSKSVSEYTYVRGLEKLGIKPSGNKFVNLDPSPASTALQTGSNDVDTICVWNPFALQTLRTNKKTSVLFDSSLIPEEVIDMVVVANSSLEKNNGSDFACCLCDIFYEVCNRLENPKTTNETVQSLGAEFCNLGIEDMKICCQETKFYLTPDSGISLFSSDKFQKTMEVVVDTCKKLEILPSASPSIGYSSSGKLNFETKYMKKVSGQ